MLLACAGPHRKAVDARAGARQIAPMETLILMRHGKAVREHEAPTDRARALTERGRADAAAVGAQLAKSGLTIDLALVSPAVRTQETFEAVQSTLGPTVSRTIERLYMADAEEIFETALAAGAQRVLVIGHNPGMHDLVRRLIAQAYDHSAVAQDLSAHFPTSAFAAFELSGDVLDAAGPRLLAAARP